MNSLAIFEHKEILTGKLYLTNPNMKNSGMGGGGGLVGRVVYFSDGIYAVDSCWKPID